MTASVDPWLQSTDILDHVHPHVRAQALALRAEEEAETARCAFDWVRDRIRHAVDFGIDTVACSASEALAARAGLCFAKSHLLVALLRACGLPAGLAYQRVRFGERFVLHGLVGVCLPTTGWYLCDPRGNKPGIDARFTPPVERLAFEAGPMSSPYPTSSPTRSPRSCGPFAGAGTWRRASGRSRTWKARFAPNTPGRRPPREHEPLKCFPAHPEVRALGHIHTARKALWGCGVMVADPDFILDFHEGAPGGSGPSDGAGNAVSPATPAQPISSQLGDQERTPARLVATARSASGAAVAAVRRRAAVKSRPSLAPASATCASCA